MTTCAVARLWQEDVADIKVAIEALLAVQTPVDAEAAITSSRPISAGVIATGALTFAVANSGSGAGTFNGASLPAGAALNFEPIPGYLYPAVGYDATGTTFILEVVRPA